MQYFVEGRRGAPKYLWRNLPCMHCDFVADFPEQLGEHIINEHGILTLWSSAEFKSEWERIKNEKR